jgi:DNA integrity scanning protein DisA with diadenylate cyclase activity
VSDVTGGGESFRRLFFGGRRYRISEIRRQEKAYTEVAEGTEFTEKRKIGEIVALEGESPAFGVIRDQL